ncbi:hypothetical protein HGRIS_008909 [Hohenbuehelia grisea]|uniref:Uncharacterized protein n=1 Tax=Hohenbuehelia grisea TaxID=104357 RepID=A0ABR3IZP1_9AGAR
MVQMLFRYPKLSLRPAVLLALTLALITTLSSTSFVAAAAIPSSSFDSLSALDLDSILEQEDWSLRDLDSATEEIANIYTREEKLLEELQGLPGGNDEYIEAIIEISRRAAGAAAMGEAVGDMVRAGIDRVTNGISDDNNAREAFTKDLVEQYRRKYPDYNVFVVHPSHTCKWVGEKNESWFHYHQEFDLKIGGTVGYEIYLGKEGECTLHGDGGFMNWAFGGEVIVKKGKCIIFGKPKE